MVQISRSAKLYQERRQPQFQPTMRGPGPQVYLPNNPVHSLTLEPPLPYPPTCIESTSNANVEVPVVDTNTTQVWPYGDKYAV
ncbi:hypothetical protein EBZ39_00045 [bacterium]|nr:hypothetical protein [bacterium]